MRNFGIWVVSWVFSVQNKPPPLFVRGGLPDMRDGCMRAALQEFDPAVQEFHAYDSEN